MRHVEDVPTGVATSTRLAHRLLGPGASCWLKLWAEDNKRKSVRSSAGAIGLIQSMSGTWSEMRARLNLIFNRDDPHDNILARAKVLIQALRRYPSAQQPGLPTTGAGNGFTAYPASDFR
ncbi:lytic transglycosylase domain-containing protein [Sphingobium sp. CECT 9361]|uniref:lytic transglycosylase domain-containing protein n=1 Tax=Sphingobium sp. CECT 9361 TaxID=2845384 RepID=UPI001E3AF140|nr:lytic transglycosylase domain-containing protein [Sphingobium sp. CECT 9361]